MSLFSKLWDLILKNEKNKELSEQELLNVIDVQGNFLYTRDNFIFSYIKINPINLQLWSTDELKTNLLKYTAEFSSEDTIFSLYSISRPTEISGVILNYERILKKTEDIIQKQIISTELNHLQSLSSVGQAIEKQTYIIVWKKRTDYAEKELTKRTQDWLRRFESSGGSAYVLGEHEIVQLINGFTNPSTAYDEELEHLNNYPDLSRIRLKGE